MFYYDKDELERAIEKDGIVDVVLDQLNNADYERGYIEELQADVESLKTIVAHLIAQLSTSDIMTKIRLKATLAQVWARKRNFNKAKLCGMRITLQRMRHDFTLTKNEGDYCSNLITQLDGILTLWDKNNQESKAKFLNIWKVRTKL